MPTRPSRMLLLAAFSVACLAACSSKIDGQAEFAGVEPSTAVSGSGSSGPSGSASASGSDSPSASDSSPSDSSPSDSSPSDSSPSGSGTDGSDTGGDKPDICNVLHQINLKSIVGGNPKIVREGLGCTIEDDKAGIYISARFYDSPVSLYLEPGDAQPLTVSGQPGLTSGDKQVVSTVGDIDKDGCLDFIGAQKATGVRLISAILPSYVD